MNLQLFCATLLLLCTCTYPQIFPTAYHQTQFPDPSASQSTTPFHLESISASPLSRNMTQEFDTPASPLTHIESQEVKFQKNSSEIEDPEIEDPEIPSKFKPSYFFIDRMHDENKKWETLSNEDKYWKEFLQGLACRAKIYIKQMIEALPKFLERADQYSDNKTPLQLAQLYQYQEMIELLKELGA